MIQPALFMMAGLAQVKEEGTSCYNICQQGSQLMFHVCDGRSTENVQ